MRKSNTDKQCDWPGLLFGPLFISITVVYFVFFLCYYSKRSKKKKYNSEYTAVYFNRIILQMPLLPNKINHTVNYLVFFFYSFFGITYIFDYVFFKSSLFLDVDG